MTGTLLEVGITEGVILHEFTNSRRQPDRLYELGIGICPDNFGTGYSNLRYLSQRPIDVLKTDRAFISHLDRRIESQHLGRLSSSATQRV